MTFQPCHNQACAEADPMSPCVCRCGGWGHAAKTQPSLFQSYEMNDPDQVIHRLDRGLTIKHPRSN